MNLCEAGDHETSGYRDGSQGRPSCAAAFSADHRGTYRSAWDEGIRRFCTVENGYQQGSQGAPFVAVCPDSLATNYLDGYQSGYALYLMQLEVDATERAIEAKSNDLEAVWSALDALSSNLEQSDAGTAQRDRWLDESRSLSARQREIGAELDELEADVAARKAQLNQSRGAIAISD